MSFVFDASVALTIAFDEEEMAGAERAFDALETSPAMVPAIWPAEIANALALGERRKRITDEDIEWFIGKLQTLTIEIDFEGTLAALDRALPLARTLGLSAYDALYLELAQRRRIPLATLDKKLAAAATKISVELMLE